MILIAVSCCIILSWCNIRILMPTTPIIFYINYMSSITVISVIFFVLLQWDFHTRDDSVESGLIGLGFHFWKNLLLKHMNHQTWKHHVLSRLTDVTSSLWRQSATPRRSRENRGQQQVSWDYTVSHYFSVKVQAARAQHRTGLLWTHLPDDAAHFFAMHEQSDGERDVQSSFNHTRVHDDQWDEPGIFGHGWLTCQHTHTHTQSQIHTADKHCTSENTVGPSSTHDNASLLPQTGVNTTMNGVILQKHKDSYWSAAYSEKYEFRFRLKTHSRKFTTINMTIFRVVKKC